MTNDTAHAGETPRVGHTLARLHAVVHGHVQGVFFRAHTRRWAADLGLTGYVRNLGDGAVEVVAEGERAALEQLLGRLRRGPPQAWVQDVAVDWLPPSGEFWAFEVRY